MKFLLKFTFAIFIAILAIFFISSFLPFRRDSVILPKALMGNWINAVNNNFEYGFFEDFAIYQNRFINYERVIDNGGGVYKIFFEDQAGPKELKLQVNSRGEMTVLEKGGSNSRFVLMKSKYPEYKIQDTSSFQRPDFKVDSVTVIGYYRNLDAGLKGFVDRFFRAPFEVSLYDFIKGEDVKYYADFDKLGRFKITFPVMNAQELYLDWKRARIKAVAEPGDTLLLILDVNDYVPQKTDGSYQGNLQRSKQVLFMGRNARINNELNAYPESTVSLDRSLGANLGDMDYLEKCKEIFNKRNAHLGSYIQSHRTLSSKFVTYKQKEEKYDFAFNLMQHRFDISGRQNPKLEEQYLKFVNDNFSLGNDLDYMLTRYFGLFLNDYLKYLSGNGASGSVLFKDIGQRLKDDHKLTPDIASQISEIDVLLRKLDSSPHKETIYAQLDKRSADLNSLELIRKTAEVLQSEKSFLDFSTVDVLLINPNLKELWITNRYHYWFEVLRRPLSRQADMFFMENVHNPFLVHNIQQLQAHYQVLGNQNKSFIADHVKPLQDSKNAKQLLKDLLKPYQGKVVYMDFWGTWCSPCRKDLKFANSLKSKVNSKDVVYLYLANRSPEETWKNIISEYNLIGDNVVHHRLPNEQQAMLERELGVTSFPTYILVDRSGTIISNKPGSPSNLDVTVSNIKKAL
ncbi:Thiol-disulfide isomerase or thioredoxin [Pedobacter suwonensis]|uniref:Thiol-disulfide isomerase or thioredoxin n=1 Tax=Pedobacter suwonensis TaxID=332999 RepID=A0A1I0SP63_9SPHI|nr:TlpA disulfide reductase family protein [Pedobacter suwonensis]SFA41262.1 Thiol-disulfide isomerase or thioredoxin [Pedobacter suwonensis]